MPNPQLSAEQHGEANKLLADIRDRIQRLAGADTDLVFAYRRYVSKKLIYDERSNPGKRRRLKQKLMKAQSGVCAACHQALPERGSVLDRRVAKDGYVEANVEVICRSCDAQRQGTKGYS